MISKVICCVIFFMSLCFNLSSSENAIQSILKKVQKKTYYKIYIIDNLGRGDPLSMQIKSFITNLEEISEDDDIYFDIEATDLFINKTTYECMNNESIAPALLIELEIFKPDLVVIGSDIGFEYLVYPITKHYKTLVLGSYTPIDNYIKLFGLDIHRFYSMYFNYNITNLVNLLNDSYFIANKFYILTEKQATLTRSHHTAVLVRNYVKQLKALGLEYSIIEVNDIVHLKSIIQKLNNQNTSVLMILLSRLIDPVNSKLVFYEDINSTIIKYNTKHLEVGINHDYTKHGLAMSIGPCYYTHGELAATHLFELEMIPEMTSSKLSVNITRLQKLNMQKLYNYKGIHYHYAERYEYD